MATVIKIGFCKSCGQLKAMKSFEVAEGHRRLIEVYCPYCAGEVEKHDLPLYESYTLDVEVRKEEATQDEDTDSGDV